MADLGRLVVNLEANVARFTSDLGRASQQTEQAMNKISGAVNFAKGALGALGVALSVGALISEANKAIDALANLDDMAQKTGSSVENLSKLSQVAAMTGVEFGTVDAALVKLAKNMASADEKGSKFKKAMDAIGISTKDIAQQDPSAVFVEIADKLQSYGDGAGKAALMTDAISKSAADLLPYMNDVSENIKSFTGATAEAAQAASKYQDDLGRMKVKYDQMVVSIVSAALPATNDFVGALSDVINGANGVEGTDVAGWADNVAVGLARVVDVAILLPRLLSAVGGSFKVVGADLSSFVQIAAEANPLMMAKTIAQGGNPIENIKRIADERNKVLDAANVKWDNLWDKPANQFEQAVLGKIDARAHGPASSAAAGPTKKTLAYSGGEGADKEILAAQLKDMDAAYAQARDIASFHEQYMSTLRAQEVVDVATYEKFKAASIEAGAIAADKHYSAGIALLEKARDAAASTAEKTELNGRISEKVALKEKARIDAIQEGAMQTLAMSAAQSDLNQQMKEWSIQQDRATSQLQFNNDLYGKSALEVAKLTAARQLQLEVEEKIRKAQEQGAISQDAIARFTKEASDKAKIANDAATKGAGLGIMQSLETPQEAENRNHANTLRDLQAFRDQELADTIAANQAIERENGRHERAKFDMKMSTERSIVSLMGDSTNQLYGMLKQAGLEQTAIGKAAFLASKALAIAQIILSTNVAAAAALAPPPMGLGPVAGLGYAGMIKGMGYASAAMVAGLSIAEASAERGYDIPGGVNPVTQLHEKEMVLPKAQADVIRGLASRGGAGGGPTVHQTNNIYIDSRTDQSEVHQLISGAVQQGNAELVDRLQRAGRI